MSENTNTLTERQRRNCHILATEVLPRVKDKQFNMGDWVAEHACGTVGCAMGWAALSGKIPGLQWCAPVKGSTMQHAEVDPARWAKTVDTANIRLAMPVLNGQRTNFTDAAVHAFGFETDRDVFMNLYASKETTIRRLMNLAAGRKANHDS